MGGLMDYKARFYSPILGRFTQPDTIIPGGPQGLNRYSYVGNRPINFNDPTGHMMTDDSDGGGKCDLKCLEKDNKKNEENYSDWNSRKYGGCFKCHAAAANGQIALTNGQLADAYSNITTWQAIGYTPIVATIVIVGAPALGPSIYNAAGVSCLSSPVCVTLTGMAGGASAADQARAWQGSGNYLGVDNWRNRMLSRGSIVWGTTPPQSNFYTNGQTVRIAGNNAASIYNGLQIKPDLLLGYRPGITQYVVTRNIQVAESIATANNYGAGGFTQYFIPNFEEVLEPVFTLLLK